MSEALKSLKTPRVFIVEQQPFDYTPATVFGHLEFLEADHLAPNAPNAPDTWNRRVVHTLQKGLSDYVADYDYVIPTGAPSRMLVVGMLLATKGKIHRILGWDNRQRRYMEYKINL